MVIAVDRNAQADAKVQIIQSARVFFLPTHSSMVTSVHADTNSQPAPIVRSGPGPSGPGIRRRAQSLRHELWTSTVLGPMRPAPS